MADRFNLKIDLQRSQQLPGTSIFLIHEGFYIEICFQDNDTLTSVKLSQANTTQVRGDDVVGSTPYELFVDVGGVSGVGTSFGKARLCQL